MCISLHQTEAPFCKESICFVGNRLFMAIFKELLEYIKLLICSESQSVYGNFQGINKIY